MTSNGGLVMVNGGGEEVNHTSHSIDGFHVETTAMVPETCIQEEEEEQLQNKNKHKFTINDIYNMILLVILYCIQGVPLGLSIGSV